MVEAIFRLDDVDLVEFFGVNNQNLNIYRRIFKNIKFTARGDELKVSGTDADVERFAKLFDMALNIYLREGKIDEDQLINLITHEEMPKAPSELSEAPIVFGPNGLVVKARTRNQKILVEAAFKNDIVFAIGPAGSGKTYTAVALAVRALKNREVKKIILTRPAVEAGENLGFLPGDLKEKIDPYLRPLYDALGDMLPPAKLAGYIESGIIEIAPLAFMRGRTLDKAFVILDEAQNTTEMQLKMFLTRMGPNAKFIITGDLTQVDLPRNQRSGLYQALRLLEETEGIEIVRLYEEDVVRHKLVKKIIKAYEQDHENRQKNKNNTEQSANNELKA